MNEVLILAKLSIHPLDESTAERYYTQIQPVLNDLPGFLGHGLWRGTAGNGAHLAVYQYKDYESAEAGLKAISGQRSFTSAQNVVSAPADVVRCTTFCERGIRISESPVGSFLSVSSRISDPGYGPDLAEELERIFDELQIIDGFLGSYVGVNETLDEEVIGLVAWSTDEAFQKSLPKRLPYAVDLFYKVI